MKGCKSMFHKIILFIRLSGEPTYSISELGLVWKDRNGYERIGRLEGIFCRSLNVRASWKNHSALEGRRSEGLKKRGLCEHSCVCYYAVFCILLSCVLGILQRSTILQTLPVVDCGSGAGHMKVGVGGELTLNLGAGRTFELWRWNRLPDLFSRMRRLFGRVFHSVHKIMTSIFVCEQCLIFDFFRGDCIMNIDNSDQWRVLSNILILL